MTQSASLGQFMQRRGVRQFIKFCIIGFSSMIIDISIQLYLIRALNWNWILAQTLSFCVAVSNGYIWNSMWTFKGVGESKHHEMYLKFVGVNVIGLVLNLIIMNIVFLLFTGHLLLHGNPTKMQWNVAKGCAVVLVAIWNFFASKKWTFT